MDENALFERYQDLQRYVGWSEIDAQRIRNCAELLKPRLAGLIDDFYEEIDRHPEARRVITGGAAQVERLKGSLRGWLSELLSGVYDQEYVSRRWRVGRRHVEIGLSQIYTNAALSRLRKGLIQILNEHWNSDPVSLFETVTSLNKLLDLDLAEIEDAYQTEYQARQQRSERLAAIGQVAGGIAHELRNPLNVVKTSVYYLLNAKAPTAEKTAEHLARIERQVGVADSVITTLSNFARMPLPQLKPIAVVECAQAVLETNPLPQGIEAVVDIPDSIPAVQADFEQLRIVLGNLVRNARDAMPQGGRLVISAALLNEHVEVAVADNGVGIAPERLKMIAEPLYSTKARGMGLGLAISQSILEKHGTRLEVTSAPKLGTRIAFRLSVAREGFTSRGGK